MICVGLVPASDMKNPAITSAPPSALLRLLDAAANRAREGLRVIEDYVRFVRNDRELSQALKTHRHQLTQLLNRLPATELLAHRDTTGDVGTAISTPAEQSRADLPQVLAANFKRLQEALRSLEEYSKLVDPTLAADLEQLRYQTYTLEQRVLLSGGGREQLHAARLYVLIDGCPSLDDFEQLARSLIEAGVHVLQLRDKQLTDRELLERARHLRLLTRNTGTLFIMNDRPDLAVLAEAHGVHVGQEEVAVADARSIVGPEALIGVSTHSLMQARQSVADGADYLGVGPTFPSGTKQFDAFPGLDLLQAVATEICLPAFAIGGISGGNLASVLSTGFTRIAVNAAVCRASDPAASARELLSQLSPRSLERTFFP